ncbi:MAG: YybH family protein [Bacteroidia bacterium]
MKYTPFLLLILLFTACTSETKVQPPAPFNPATVQPEIEGLNINFGKGIREKNAAIIAANYDLAAHLCPDNDTYINGRTAIENWWKESITQLDDMTLTTISLEGTRDVLYETGMATTTIHIGDSVWVQNDKYVNVWKLQADSSYRIVVDIWNGIDKK